RAVRAARSAIDMLNTTSTAASAPRPAAGASGPATTCSARSSSAMTRAPSPPLTPFVHALPLPSRLIATEHDGQLTVRLRAGEHRFHRALPASSVWGFEGMVPGPTIEAERGQPVTVDWRNE